MKKPSISSDKISAVLASRKFFIGIMVVMTLQAVWVALTGKYPMAFDEDFHFGIIKLYAHHISPFWTSHPANADAFGAITRDPSYLFQYLLSFPYRLIQLFTNNQTTQVIFLRLINAALFVSGLPLFKKLLVSISHSNKLANVVLAITILIPIVPLLAGQINYDNVIFPLTALLLLLTVRILRDLSEKRLAVLPLLQFIGVGLFACLIKYAFLPIFIAAAACIAVQTLRSFKLRKLDRVLMREARPALALRSGKFILTALVVLLVLSFERYGVNVIRYHTPVPDCSQVLTFNQCKSYGPWIRDYNLAAYNTAHPHPKDFASDWIKGMWLRTFFTLAGPSQDYETRGPFRVPAIGALGFAALGISALALRGRRIWHGQAATLTMLAAVSVFYLAVLYFQQYQFYSQTGVPVAINGRYLIPLAPVLLFFGAIATRALIKKDAYKNALAVIAILVMAHGGGVLTFILRSNDGWYWPSPIVRTANHAVQNIVGPVTIGYRSPTQFLPYEP